MRHFRKIVESYLQRFGYVILDPCELNQKKFSLRKKYTKITLGLRCRDGMFILLCEFYNYLIVVKLTSAPEFLQNHYVVENISKLVQSWNIIFIC